MSKVCQVLNLSKRQYYNVNLKKVSEKTAIEKAVINAFTQHQGNLGRVRIKKELAKVGIVVSEYKISKIMKKYGLITKLGRKRRKKVYKPTPAEHLAENLVYKNLLGHKANELFCADIHEMRYKYGKIYVSGIIDAGTRAIIGWDIQRHQRQGIVIDSIKMAIGRRPEAKGKAIFHSDRGCQYTAKETQKLLRASGLKISMSRPGTPNDNQLIESFWRTMDIEMEQIDKLNFIEAKKIIINYIEMYYNSSRIHSGINYLTPNEAYEIA